MSRVRAAILLVCAAAACRGNVVKSLAKEVQDTVVAVKQPIEETLVYVGSSQCSKVKRILGIAYEQVEGESGPDVNRLNLQLQTRDHTSVYGISGAARALPAALEPHDKLVIFVHGFTDDPTKASFQNISEALLARGGYNVIALDGSALIKWLYLLSTTYVRFMGEKLGEVLAAMVRGGLDPKEVLIIGHSLGAHIAGFAGKTFHDLTGTKVGRISGLDPAGPCFSHVDPELRLKKTDADYVDVIHTDAGVYGLKDVIGHTDYFVNGGSSQPNCLFQTCSHSRAWLYYTESVLDPRAFPARTCRDWSAFEKNACGEERVSYMGFPSAPTDRGVYYLRTGEEPPYGLRERGLRQEAAGKSVGAVKSGIGNITSLIFG